MPGGDRICGRLYTAGVRHSRLPALKAVYGTRRGSQATRRERLSPSIAAMSASDNTKPKRSRFSWSLSSRSDFGMGTTPCWSIHRRMTCAVDTPCLRAILASVLLASIFLLCCRCVRCVWCDCLHGKVRGGVTNVGARTRLKF